MIQIEDKAVYQIPDLVVRLNKQLKGRYSFGAVWKPFSKGGPLESYCIVTGRGLACTQENATHAVDLFLHRKNVGRGRNGDYDETKLFIEAPYSLRFPTIHWLAKTSGHSVSSWRRVIYHPTPDEVGLLTGLYFDWPGGVCMDEEQYEYSYEYITSTGYGPRPKHAKPLTRKRKPLVIGGKPTPTDRVIHLVGGGKIVGVSTGKPLPAQSKKTDLIVF